MATKMFPNIAADFASSESLSFAGLVCIQDQKTEHPKMQKQVTDFEFSCSNINNNFSPDKLHSDTQISSYHHHPTPKKKIVLENLLTEIPVNKKGSSDIKQQSKHRGYSREQISQVKRRKDGKRAARVSAKNCSHSLHLAEIAAASSRHLESKSKHCSEETVENNEASSP